METGVWKPGDEMQAKQRDQANRFRVTMKATMCPSCQQYVGDKLTMEGTNSYYLRGKCGKCDTIIGREKVLP